MQVASTPPLAGVFSRTHSSTAISAARISVSVASIHVTQTLEVGEVTTVSVAARMALEYIARSRHLSRDDKKTLTRLVAVVDEFAGGDAKLMAQIIAIAQVMEASANITVPKQSWRQTMKDYLEARNALHGNSAAVISAETEINIVRIQYLDVEAGAASATPADKKTPSIS